MFWKDFQPLKKIWLKKSTIVDLRSLLKISYKTHVVGAYFFKISSYKTHVFGYVLHLIYLLNPSSRLGEFLKNI